MTGKNSFIKTIKEATPKSWRVKMRHLNAPLRKLPDYLILGTQKGGTSFLFNALSQHPQIHNSTKKETHFFDRHYQKGINHYKSHFPFAWDSRLSGEATPEYLYYAGIPPRIWEHMPYKKFIVLLRNPVDRAYSQYKMQLDRKRIPPHTSFRERITMEYASVAETEGITDLMDSEPVNDDLYLRSLSYLRRGLYVKIIRRFFIYFSFNKFLFLQSENMKENPEKVLEEVYDFLDISPFQINTSDVFSFTSESVHPPLDPVIRDELEQFFAPYNEQLFKLIGKDFQW